MSDLSFLIENQKEVIVDKNYLDKFNQDDPHK